MSAPERGLIVISGVSSGIGLAVTRMLLSRGYAVLGLSRNIRKAGLTHDNFTGVNIDLAKLDELPDAIASLIDDIRLPVRALINNAGIGKMGYLEQISVADMRRVMDLNFMSHAIITKAFLPLMKRHQQGDIIFIGSEAGLHGARQGSVYCASKFALRGFAQSLREECGKSGVRVSLINPGAVRTEFFNTLDFEPGADADNAIESQDLANILLTVLEARQGTVFDEINLSPLSQVWQKKQ